MHRFFADERGVVQGAAYLNAEDAGHALRVLRLESGDEVELVCAPARYRAKIDSTEGGEIRRGEEDRAMAEDRPRGGEAVRPRERAGGQAAAKAQRDA